MEILKWLLKVPAGTATLPTPGRCICCLSVCMHADRPHHVDAATTQTRVRKSSGDIAGMQCLYMSSTIGTILSPIRGRLNG